MQGDVSQLLEKAAQLIQSADTKEKVLEVMETYENALKIEPKNREALTGAFSYSFLIAHGYSSNKAEKRTWYLKTIRYSEQLMYLNHEFANLVDKGEKVWDACRVLSKEELEALFLYYLGVGSLWKECLSGLRKIVNLKTVFGVKKILEAMMEIDPTYGAGKLYYARANYYATVPRFAGGDVRKAEEDYKKAIELGPDMLSFRRTRALMLHTKNKDRAAFEKDLNWVISQDPNKFRPHFAYPWSVFIQRDARDMLEHIDDYFD
jgi:tetratricopeptide (TPR) repeat protein